jgi:hypothetical protein
MNDGRVDLLMKLSKPDEDQFAVMLADARMVAKDIEKFIGDKGTRLNKSASSRGIELRRASPSIGSLSGEGAWSLEPLQVPRIPGGTEARHHIEP